MLKLLASACVLSVYDPIKPHENAYIMGNSECDNSNQNSSFQSNFSSPSTSSWSFLCLICRNMPTNRWPLLPRCVHHSRISSSPSTCSWYLLCLICLECPTDRWPLLPRCVWVLAPYYWRLFMRLYGSIRTKTVHSVFLGWELGGVVFVFTFLRVLVVT